MASIKFKFDTKKFEKQLKEIVNDKQKEIMIKSQGDDMYILNSNQETMLDVFLSKYEETKKYEIFGNDREFPDYMRFSIKDTMNELKYTGLLSHCDFFSSGNWHVILTPDALKYYLKKGSRLELFSELAKSDRELLRKIIDFDESDGNISEFLRDKVDNDKKDIVRGIIGNLKSNGLLTVFWADNTVAEAHLTQQGRTFFEREKDYEDKINKTQSKNIVNIHTINAPNGNVIIGDVIDSNLIINNTISQIESEIEARCESDEEKETLKELLDEAKEIVDNYKEIKIFTPRKKFFQRLTEHMDKHGWFYAEIANLIGQAALMKISGQI